MPTRSSVGECSTSSALRRLTRHCSSFCFAMSSRNSLRMRNGRPASATSTSPFSWISGMRSLNRPVTWFGSAQAAIVATARASGTWLAAASQVPEARAVATIAACADPNHVTGLFKERIPEIQEKGEVEVALAGRPFRIRKEFLDDIAKQKLEQCLVNLRKALLVLHSPTDDLVGIEHASAIFTAAKHPKSFVSLSGADHLLSKRSDAVYVAEVIAAWSERYLDMVPEPDEMPIDGVLVGETRNGKFEQSVVVGKHRYLADEPVSVGGNGSGPSPYEYLLAGLGACTSMTIRLYADLK